MIQSSFVLRSVIALVTWLKREYDCSLLRKMIDGVSNWVVGLIAGSALFGFFTESVSGSVLRESKVLSAAEQTNKKLAKAINEGPIGRWLDASLILQLYDRINGYYLVVLLLVVSMVFLPTSLSMALAGVILVFYAYDSIRGKNRHSKGNMVSLLIGIFIVFLIESVLNAININNAMMIAAIYILFIMVVLSMHSGIKNKKQLMILLNVMMVVMTLTCLYGIYQYIIGVEVDSAWVDETLFDSLQTRVYSVFGNPNVFGIYLVMMVPVCVALTISARHWFWRMLYLGMTAGGLLTIALTYSRGSMVSVAFAIAIMLLFMDRRFIFAGVAGAAAAPFILPASIVQRLVSVVNLQDSSVAYRISIYRASMDIIRDYFVGGLGIGGFNEVYFSYAYSASRAFHAHNTFLMVFLELGVIGFGLFMAILIFWVKTLVSAYFRCKDRTYRVLLLAFLGGVAGASLQALAEHIWFNSDVMFFYWLMLILGLVTARQAVHMDSDEGIAGL